MTVGSILITGGTSLVGSAMLRKNNTSHPIVIFARSARPESSASFVHHVRGNVFDTMSLETVLRNNPNIIHTVSHDSEYDSSLVVASALADKAQTPTLEQRRAFVFFSVASGFPSLIFNQQFVESKQQAENALLGIKFKRQIRVVVFKTGLIYSYHQRFGILPFALGLYVLGFFLKPLKSILPSEVQFLTELPILDDDVASAAFEAVENTDVEGICNGDRIRQLAKAWETKQLSQPTSLAFL